MPPKIITVTANTAIDHVITLEQWVPGDNLVAKSRVEFASGKGINVARAITSLNCEVHALGFVGEQSYSLFHGLQTSLLHTDFSSVPGQTRANLTLFDQSLQQETHIRTPGFTVTPGDERRLTEKIAALLVAGDILVLSGSLPGGASSSFYQQLIALAHQKSAITFLDSSGECLREGLRAKPHFVKPNLAELEDFMGRRLHTEQGIVHAAFSLIERGSQVVVVSRGAQGLIMVTDDNSVLKAYINTLSGEIQTSIGCGDALLGGLAVAKLRKLPLNEVIKLGLASATANLFSIEPGRFDQTQLADITEQVVIHAL